MPRVRLSLRDVPIEWETLYQTLRAAVATERAVINSEWRGSNVANTKLGCALTNANSSRYTSLFNTSDPTLANTTTLIGAKLQALALHAAGIRAVQVALSFPMLDAAFHATTDYADAKTGIEQFYFSVSGPQGIIPFLKSLGWHVTIESSFVFRNVVGGTYYDSIDLATYVSRRTDQLLRICELGGANVDILGCGAEPVNEATTSGHTEFADPADCATQYTTMLDGVNATYPTMPLAAGCGSWETDGTGFVDALCALTNLDYFDIHIYPVVSGYLTAARTLADRVNTSFPTKGLVCNQAWCYKASASELTGDIGAATDLLVRDMYDFWEPLDRAFLDMLVRLAKWKEFFFISAFYSPAFARYVPYKDAQPLSITDQLTLAAVLQGTTIVAGGYSTIGADYARGFE